MVDLSQIHLATDSVLAKAEEAIYEISADEHMRQLLEAREDAV